MTRFRQYLSAIMAAVVLSPSAHAQARPAALSGLPITEVPAAAGTTLALFWSGDGGWAEMVDSISHELARAGVAVVGMNSHKWLGHNPRTPDEAARDSEKLLRYYLAHWSRTRIMLVGFSRGADFAPFIVNRLPADLRERVVLVGLLGAERSASFEFHLSDLITSTVRASDVPSRPEIERSVGVRYLCMYGTRETNSVCPGLDRAKVTILPREGDHHLDRNYAAMAHELLVGAGIRSAATEGGG